MIDTNAYVLRVGLLLGFLPLVVLARIYKDALVFGVIEVNAKIAYISRTPALYPPRFKNLRIRVTAGSLVQLGQFKTNLVYYLGVDDVIKLLIRGNLPEIRRDVDKITLDG
jgi:hypothetical protein